MNKCIITFVILFLFNLEIESSDSVRQCQISNNNDRLDCYPQPNANESDCISRGCCWSEPNKANKDNVGKVRSIPVCYYPTNYPNYKFKYFRKTDRGIHAKLEKQQKTYLPNEISSLNLDIHYETNSRIRIRITDPRNKRFEAPVEFGSSDLHPPTNPNYEVVIPSNEPFSLEIKRKSDGQSLFKSFGPLLYSDQFIQISSKMSTDQVYGMGEQNRPFLHQLSNGWSRIGLWARDNAIDTYNNLYGTHPFYMGMPDNGKAFGVFYLNSNAQEFVLQPAPAITYRTTGGILDIFIFTGDTPEETVKQYVELVGKPMLPPYWALGFHLSRWGYENLNQMSEILQRNIDAGIPIDVQWSDIDYMDNHRDFSIDEINFNGLNGYVKNIREKYNIRYVAILDPAINKNKTITYASYDEGLQMNVYIRDAITNEPLVGKVWPGDTVYPDFTHPNITKYWSKQIQTFFKALPVDGLWIDMNEPSNFGVGSKHGCLGNSPYDNPFFVPEIRDNSLLVKTICSSALHYNDVRHYNLHNLYGYSEAVTTNAILINTIPNKRVFLLSRSTFSGSGKFTFHWTGDNTANWEQLGNSIRQILNFNMFGIPMTGADICGFSNNSNEELCIRWMQLGAFYPFMRNHNTLGAIDQDPAAWSKKAQSIMKTSLNNRYSLLPHFYTLLVKSHLNGGTVMRPMSFEFYSDKITHSLDLQFMIGSSIMVAPVVYQGVTSVDAYFPSGTWYDFTTGVVLHSSENGDWLHLDAPIDKINFALRGGYIVSLLDPEINAVVGRKGNLTLYCGMSSDFTASGDLYWDDGESLDTYTENKYSYMTFSADKNGLLLSVHHFGYESLPVLTRVVVLGFKKQLVKQVTINKRRLQFTHNKVDSTLIVEDIDLNIGSSIFMRWN